MKKTIKRIGSLEKANRFEKIKTVTKIRQGEMNYYKRVVEEIELVENSRKRAEAEYERRSEIRKFKEAKINNLALGLGEKVMQRKLKELKTLLQLQDFMGEFSEKNLIAMNVKVLLSRINVFDTFEILKDTTELAKRDTIRKINKALTKVNKLLDSDVFKLPQPNTDTLIPDLLFLNNLLDMDYITIEQFETIKDEIVLSAKNKMY